MLKSRQTNERLCKSRPLWIVDVGARFGIHPVFASIKQLASFDLFEVDLEECDRLYSKYKTNHATAVRVFNYAVGSISASENLKTRINKYHNPAVSSVAERTQDESPMYDQISNEHVLESFFESPSCALDDLIIDHETYPDFLKLDVEGYEPEVLHGGKTVLANAVGIRLEVSFAKLQSQSPESGTFTLIHEALTKFGYNLLSLDYAGAGDYYSPYCSGRYGMLRSTDAVYIRNIKSSLQTRAIALRAAIFCFINNSPDVGISILTQATLRFGKFKGTHDPLERFADKELASHLHGLKWIPGQDRKLHAEVYESIFDLPYPSVQKFNESLFYNPA